MVKFQNYQRTETALEAQGTVLDIVGKDGKISLIPRNFKDESKRVVIVLQKKNGTSAAVTCSAQVSEGLRKGTIELNHILGFEVLEGESGIPFISMPGGALVTVDIKTLKVKEFTPTAMSLEDLIG